MIDIVERLRPLAGLDAYYAEALAEIELLRKINRGFQAENERLCAENDDLWMKLDKLIRALGVENG